MPRNNVATKATVGFHGALKIYNAVRVQLTKGSSVEGFRRYVCTEPVVTKFSYSKAGSVYCNAFTKNKAAVKFCLNGKCQ